MSENASDWVLKRLAAMAGERYELAREIAILNGGEVDAILIDAQKRAEGLPVSAIDILRQGLRIICIRRGLPTPKREGTE